MFRPTLEVAEKFNLRIKGIKLQLNCKKCNRVWSIWFEDENELLNNLPENWYLCSTCRDNNNVFIDKEYKNNGSISSK